MGIEHVVEDYDDGSNNNDTDAGLSTKTPFEVLFSKLEDDTPTTAALDDGAMCHVGRREARTTTNDTKTSEHDDNDFMTPLSAQFSFQSTNASKLQQHKQPLHQNRRSSNE